MNSIHDDSSALVLFSGGQDSTTCLYWARQHFAHVSAIGFNYGQRHVVELQQAEIVARRANVPFVICDIRGCLAGSALINPLLDLNAPHPRDGALPASFVPGRNALFLTLAAGQAYQQNIANLVGGMCQTDYSGYPDCRQEFVDAMQSALRLAMGAPLRIHTPLMHLTKAQTWQLAGQLGIVEIIIEDTHSDYQGDRTQRHEWGYGRLDNPASVLRAKGYAEAKSNGWI